MDLMEEVDALVRARETLLRAYQHTARPGGFWPIPWMPGAWTAAALVEKAEREEGFTEFGDMSYVMGELFHAVDGRILGEYYPYKDRGVHDHEHDFLSVLMRAILSGEVEPEQPEECYAPWMLALLERVRAEPKLRREARKWAADPWRFEGEPNDTPAWNLSAVCPELTPEVYELAVEGETAKILAADINEVYTLAACFPETLRYREEEYSKQQIENIEAVMAYQKAERSKDHGT